MVRCVRAVVRIVAWTVVAAGLVCPIATAQTATAPPAAPASTLSLADAMRVALEHNPSLVAARFGRAVAAAEIKVARERPNPDFTFERERETPYYSFAVTLPLELGSKRGRRSAVAEAGAETTAAEIAKAEADVRADVRRAFYETVAAEQRVAIARELADLAQRARDAAQARLDAGDAPRLELLQSELELARAQNELASVDAERVAVRVELNALLGLPATAATVARGELNEGVVPDTAAAVARALDSSLDLAAIDRRIREAQARVELARALRIPDFSLAGTLTKSAPGEFNTGYRAGFTVNLPILTTHRAGVVREESAVAQVRAEREAAVAQTSALVTAAAARAQALRQQIDREEHDILPRARQVEAMAEDSYRAGQTGLVVLLQALQTTRDTRLRVLENALTYQRALADLERAIGAPLP
jgi:outer membrane protein, heavy metal efflux system